MTSIVLWPITTIYVMRRRGAGSDKADGHDISIIILQLKLEELRDGLTTKARHNPQALRSISRYFELPRQGTLLVRGMKNSEVIVDEDYHRLEVRG